MKTYGLHIGGEWTEPDSREWMDAVDPFRGGVWAQVPRGNKKDVDRAVAAAKFSMEDGPWAGMSGTSRAAALRALADLMIRDADRLAELEVRDNGKLLTETKGQVKASAECWYYYAGMADKLEGMSVPIGKPNVTAFTTREPIGVVAAITAWNSPLWFIAVKCAPALAAGCSVVVKPSEFASVGSLEFAALAAEAGIPAGVFNVVTGLGADVGAALVEHPDVAKITFTGSDTAGTHIYQSAARSLKRVQLELGGKSPNIVFEDADLELAATGVVSGIFGAAGQMCSAGSRLLVQSSIKERFTEMLIEITKGIRLGDPMDPASNAGPIATRPQYEKVLHYIDVATQEGATCVLGGRAATGEGLDGGQFIEPTIFVNVDNGMRIAQEEVFGPILSVIEFEDEGQALRIANDVDFGLVAGVWTQDIGRALRMSKSLKVGTVWINTYRTYSHMLPFGGVKSSGMGRENGVEAVLEYLETKAIVLSMDNSKPENAFVMQ